MTVSENAICRNIAALIYSSEVKLDQMDKAWDITVNLTSDDGCKVLLEMYPGNLVRFTVTGTRAGFTVCGNSVTRELCRKPRNLQAWHTAECTTHFSDIMEEVRRWQG